MPKCQWICKIAAALAVATLLGALGPAEAARLRLVGVIRPPASRDGLALIVVDGGQAAVFRVGEVVSGRDVLQAVDADGVRLGPRDGASAIDLRLEVASPSLAVAAPTRSAAPVPPHGPLPSQQELFRQRQQLQFEQEEHQNRAVPP